MLISRCLAESAEDIAPEDGGARIAARRVPKAELHLLQFGTNQTDYGPFEFSEEDGADLMAWYEQKYGAREGWIDIDREHVAWADHARGDDFDSCGRFRLELRADGLWAVDVTYQQEIRDKVAEDKIRSFSVVVDFDATNHVTALRHLGLTNRPAAYDAGLLAASVSGFLKHPLMEGAWSAKQADKRIRQKLSSDDSGDLDKVDIKRYRACHAFYDGDNPDQVSGFKGLICDVEDDTIKLHRGAIQALAAAMQGARGGIDVSDDDMEKGRKLLSRYYQRWDAQAPWDKEKQMGEKKLSSRLLLLAENDAGMMAKMDAILEACRAMPGMSCAQMEECYDDRCVCSVYHCPTCSMCCESVYCEHCHQCCCTEHFYHVPYTFSAGKVTLGQAGEVIKHYVPKEQASEVVAMKERLTSAEDGVKKAQAALSEVLKATGADSATAAIAQIRALKEGACDSAKLSERLVRLEADQVTREKTAILSEAKAAGRWTRDLETRGEEVCQLAERLGDDPCTEYRKHWKSAPVLTGQPQETPRQTEGRTTARLTEEQRRSAQQLAFRLGMDSKKLEEGMAAL